MPALTLGAACEVERSRPAAATDTAVTAAAFDSATTFPRISADGIGAARRGMTMRDFRAALPAGLVVGNVRDDFMVDLRALPIIADADTLYYLLFVQPTEVTDTTTLELAATLHPGVRTAEGVGPGTPIADAAVRYGEPTLSYNINDESREYAAFPRFAASNVLFRVMPGSGEASHAGRYTTSGEHNETTSYDPQAGIMMVMVNLRR